MRWLGGIIDSMDIKLRDSGGQGSLMCCSPLGCKELDMTYGITTRVECSLCPHDSDLIKVQNVSQTAFCIALNERSGMLRYAPEKCHRRSSGGWLNFRGPTPCSLVQAGTDMEPLDTNHCCNPRFFPYMGGPGLDAGPGYKTSPHPSYLADSLCLLAHPPPGVLPESNRPIKAFINGP